MSPCNLLFFLKKFDTDSKVVEDQFVLKGMMYVWVRHIHDQIDSTCKPVRPVFAPVNPARPALTPANVRFHKGSVSPICRACPAIRLRD